MLVSLLVGGLSLGSVGLVGCDMITKDPMKQNIPTDSDKWQDKLGDTFEELSAEDRQVLSRYMLRMKLSGAYESGAMPSTTIGEALKQQREYERRHPNNPVGKDSPVLNGAGENSLQATYPITVLPAKASESDSLNNVRLMLVLSNYGDVPVASFEGTLSLQAPAFKESKQMSIPLTTFDPHIAPDNGSKLSYDTSIEDMNVMRAIKEPAKVTITITEGTLTLANGETVSFAGQ